MEKLKYFVETTSLTHFAGLNQGGMDFFNRFLKEERILLRLNHEED